MISISHWGMFDVPTEHPISINRLLIEFNREIDRNKYQHLYFGKLD